MKLVAIESPLAGDFDRNRRYALWCAYDSLGRGEAPFASHLIYPQVLNDTVARERALGIEAGFAWAALANLRAAYEDLGVSNGMRLGVEAAAKRGQAVQWRRLPPDMLAAFNRGEAPRSTHAFA